MRPGKSSIIITLPVKKDQLPWATTYHEEGKSGTILLQTTKDDSVVLVVNYGISNTIVLEIP